MWTACTLSVFQLLSEDYISYVFFILFVGIAVGAVQVTVMPYVIEMVGKMFFFSCSSYSRLFLLSFVLNIESFMVYC